MRLTILILFTVLTHELFGQDKIRFKNFHGIKQPQGMGDFFEAEGYDIFIQPIDNGLSEKETSKIKKKYSIKDGQVTTDSLLNIQTLKKIEQVRGVTTYSTYYLIADTEKKTTVIGFVRAKSRDIDLERDFVKSFLHEQIPSFIYTELEIDSINFVGRTIRLGSACHWMSPHNIQCPNLGQMNWAIFDSLDKAEEYRDTRYEMTKNTSLTTVIKEEWITLKFEGIEAKALRTKVKIKLPKAVMGGSNILIVYYVTGQVRGKYVTCILSQYTDDVNGDELAPLLSEVLTLKASDGTWKENQGTDKIEEEPKTDPSEGLTEYEKRDRGLTFKLEAGVWAPIGNLGNTMGLSPNFSIWWGVPFRNHRNFRIDMGTSVFVPQNMEEFEYLLPDSVFTTKIKSVSGVLGLQLTKTNKVSNSIAMDYFDFVTGIGIGFFQTGDEKPKANPKDEDDWYSIDTIHLSCGVTLRKIVFKRKSIGIAFRYNFTPPRLFQSNVQEGFGNSSITTSLQFKL